MWFGLRLHLNDRTETQQDKPKLPRDFFSWFLKISDFELNTHFRNKHRWRRWWSHNNSVLAGFSQGGGSHPILQIVYTTRKCWNQNSCRSRISVAIDLEVVSAAMGHQTMSFSFHNDKHLGGVQKKNDCIRTEPWGTPLKEVSSNFWIINSCLWGMIQTTLLHSLWN